VVVCSVGAGCAGVVVSANAGTENTKHNVSTIANVFFILSTPSLYLYYNFRVEISISGVFCNLVYKPEKQN
jgi:hypothetical protein